MKRLLISLLCIGLLSGCGSKTDGTSLDDTQNETTQQTTSSHYDDFENGLKNGSYTFNQKTSLDTTGIGAKEGYRYTMEDGTYIDIYRFEDENVLSQLEDERSININGENKSVEINDDLVMITDNVKDDLVSVFKGI